MVWMALKNEIVYLVLLEHLMICMTVWGTLCMQVCLLTIINYLYIRTPNISMLLSSGQRQRQRKVKLLLKESYLKVPSECNWLIMTRFGMLVYTFCLTKKKVKIEYHLDVIPKYSHYIWNYNHIDNHRHNHSSHVIKNWHFV